MSETQAAARMLRYIYDAAVAAVSPAPAVHAALTDNDFWDIERIWVVALGKAAHAMTEGAVAHLRAAGREPAGGIIVAASAVTPPHDSLVVCAGDHPLPGSGSAEAARRIERVLDGVSSRDGVLVLLSGGATSLAAAPAGEFRLDELSEAYALLLGSGLDISAMNAVRKRITRWGAGRLAQVARGARLRVLVISDVVGDDLATIASGPCIPDPLTAREVRARLEASSLWLRMPPGIRRYVEQVERDPARETPKPGDPTFAHVEHRIVASNRQAVEAAAHHAQKLGFDVSLRDVPLTGEAAAAGAMIARELLQEEDSRGGGWLVAGDNPEPAHANARAAPRHLPPAPPRTRRRCTIWGGETTVRLGDMPEARGGRCQELALACARDLAAAAAPIAVLAGGTDGRDGNSDAAGAIVDASTWQRIIAGGRDPAHDLRRHASYDALASVGALFHTGLTGTNVMDLVIGIRGS